MAMIPGSSAACSLVPQSGQWIARDGALRRDVDGNSRDEREKPRNSREGDGVQGRYTVEQSGHAGHRGHTQNQTQD